MAYGFRVCHRRPTPRVSLLHLHLICLHLVYPSFTHHFHPCIRAQRFIVDSVCPSERRKNEMDGLTSRTRTSGLWGRRAEGRGGLGWARRRPRARRREGRGGAQTRNEGWKGQTNIPATAKIPFNSIENERLQDILVLPRPTGKQRKHELHTLWFMRHSVKICIVVSQQNMA